MESSRPDRRLRLITASTLLFCVAIPLVLNASLQLLKQTFHESGGAGPAVVVVAVQALAIPFTLLWLWQGLRSPVNALLGVGVLLFLMFFFISLGGIVLAAGIWMSATGESPVVLWIGACWCTAAFHYGYWSHCAIQVTGRKATALGVAMIVAVFLTGAAAVVARLVERAAPGGPWP